MGELARVDPDCILPSLACAAFSVLEARPSLDDLSAQVAMQRTQLLDGVLDGHDGVAAAACAVTKAGSWPKAAAPSGIRCASRLDVVEPRTAHAKVGPSRSRRDPNVSSLGESAAHDVWNSICAAG